MTDKQTMTPRTAALMARQFDEARKLKDGIPREEIAAAWIDLAMEIEAELSAANARLAEYAREAAEDVSEWGAYANQYFQAKWNLDGCIKKWQDRALAPQSERPDYGVVVPRSPAQCYKEVMRQFSFDDTHPFTRTLAALFAMQDSLTETKAALERCQNEVHRFHVAAAKEPKK